MPKPTRTPERISLPSDFSMEKCTDGWKIVWPEGCNRWFLKDMPDAVAESFAKHMNGPAIMRVTGFRGNPLRLVLNNGRECAITPKLIAALQSPAGEWRDIGMVKVGTPVFCYRKGYESPTPFCGVVDEYIPGKLCVLDTVSGKFISPKVVWPLPPAPTGEEE